MCDGVIFVLSTRAEEARFERKSLFDALVIFAGTRIDADLVAGIDEQGNLDRRTRIHRCGFERVGRGGIAFDARFGIGHFHIDDRRKFGRKNGLLLGVEHHLDDLTVGHQVVIVDQVLVDVDLLESFRMHEVRTQIVFVGELIGTALHTHRLDLRTGGEGILQHAAVFQVFEFGTHESGALARFHVLKIYDLEGLAVQFDAHADLDVCCSCHRNIFIYDFSRRQSYEKSA